MSDAPDFTLLAQLVRQVIAEQAVARDDARVMTAMLMRQDNTLAALLVEIRAMHSRHARLDDRVRSLEARSTPL